MHVSRLLARALDFLRQRLSGEELDTPASTAIAG
jgi:urease beta subunit